MREETGPDENGTTRYVGLDVHKATLTVAVGELSGLPALYRTIANDPGAVLKLAHQLTRGYQGDYRRQFLTSAATLASQVLDFSFHVSVFRVRGLL